MSTLGIYKQSFNNEFKVTSILCISLSFEKKDYTVDYIIIVVILQAKKLYQKWSKEDLEQGAVELLSHWKN